MKFLYLAAIYPTAFISKSDVSIISPAYKFNKIFAEAFASRNDRGVFSYFPFACKERIGDKHYNSVIVENGVNYVILKKKDYSSYFKYVISIIKDVKQRFKKDNLFVICDALSISLVVVSLVLRSLYKIKNSFIITDFPQYVGNLEKTFFQKLKCNLLLKMMKMGDSFILLTEMMCDVINPSRKKKYTVIEGFCKKEEACRNLEFSDKSNLKICMYAGSLHKEYGIDLLIKAFVNANAENAELHIYGSGNYLEEIKKLCMEHKNVKYFGVVSNDVIVEEERKVSLLINPRLSSEEFTKYSFPSKTLEYMASGTPVLMNKLPGLPIEYYPYLYFFTDESLIGYEEGLKKVLSNDLRQLHTFGLNSKQFVLNNKTADIQVEKFFHDILE